MCSKDCWHVWEDGNCSESRYLENGTHHSDVGGIETRLEIGFRWMCKIPSNEFKDSIYWLQGWKAKREMEQMEMLERQMKSGVRWEDLKQEDGKNTLLHLLVTFGNLYYGV